MAIRTYVLNERGNPVPTEDLLAWGRWMGESNGSRIVAVDTIGDARVSTVFLGLDHNYSFEGPPVLWETMIFGGEHDSYQTRYTSKDDAVKGHEEALRLVRGS